MKGSRGIKPRRVLALIAMLFGAMVTTLQRPAYGQQEVDPTWYDPWAASNTVVVHSSHPRVAVHRHQRTVRSVSSSPVAGKVRGKQRATQPKAS